MSRHECRRGAGGPLHRLVIGAALVAAFRPAQADWACQDAFGYRYQTRNRFGDQADVVCALEPSEPAIPAPSAGGPVLAPFPAVPLASLGAPHAGGLVLVARPGGIRPQARGSAYDALIDAAGRDQGVDPDLVRAIVQVESGFDPAAVSARGAIGLMQLLPATASDLGIPDPASSLLLPEENLRAGAMHLRHLLQRFDGAIELAIAAYNAGEGAVLRHGPNVPPYRETQDYVREVLATYRALQASR